ncbi:MAG: hypothetical protein AAB932_01260, partial [Patescibacteria group bacterium]
EANGGSIIRIDRVIEYWNEHCADLPPLDKGKNEWFFWLLAMGRLTDTVDGNSRTVVGRRHVPDFGHPEFLLCLDWPEFDPENAEEVARAEAHLGMKIFKESKFSSGTDPKGPKRYEIDITLWEGDCNKRIQTAAMKQVVRELLTREENPDDFELRLIRYDEYVRVAHDKNYGQKDLLTHFEGYTTGEKRDGFYGGYRLPGGAIGVGASDRAYAAVRLVLARKRQM